MPENVSYLLEIVSRSSYFSLASLKFPLFSVSIFFFILYNKDNLGASSEGIPDASGILHLNEAFYKKLSGVMFYVKFNEN